MQTRRSAPRRGSEPCRSPGWRRRRAPAAGRAAPAEAAHECTAERPARTPRGTPDRRRRLGWLRSGDRRAHGRTAVRPAGTGAHRPAHRRAPEHLAGDHRQTLRARGGPGHARRDPPAGPDLRGAARPPHARRRRPDRDLVRRQGAPHPARDRSALPLGGSDTGRRRDRRGLDRPARRRHARPAGDQAPRRRRRGAGPAGGACAQHARERLEIPAGRPLRRHRIDGPSARIPWRRARDRPAMRSTTRSPSTSNS